MMQTKRALANLFFEKSLLKLDLVLKPLLLC